MKILVVNAGSSSLKYQLIDMVSESILCKGQIERIGIQGTRMEHKKGEEILVGEKYLANHTDALALVVKALTNPVYGAVASISEIHAIGHRVVHAGEDFTGSVLIDDVVMEKMRGNTDLAPLHMPANLACIASCREVFGNIPMAAVFDTAFHATMPKRAFLYAINYEDYKQYKVRRYGFHGTSHKFISGIARELLGKEHSKIVTCHLGNGSSVAAVVDGKCVDTSMGMTPLEGLVMGTRSGDVDPSVVPFLMEKKNLDTKGIANYLNKECGFLGITGFSSDSRDIVNKAEAGNARAKLALEMTSYRIKKYIGAYTAAMGGLDCIVFTGGIGENSQQTREMVMQNMEYLGIDFDFEKNNALERGTISELTKAGSKVKVYVIPTNEELVIARETKDLI